MNKNQFWPPGCAFPPAAPWLAVGVATGAIPLKGRKDGSKEFLSPNTRVFTMDDLRPFFESIQGLEALRSWLRGMYPLASEDAIRQIVGILQFDYGAMQSQSLAGRTPNVVLLTVVVNGGITTIDEEFGSFSGQYYGTEDSGKNVNGGGGGSGKNFEKVPSEFTIFGWRLQSQGNGPDVGDQTAITSTGPFPKSLPKFSTHFHS